MGGLSNYPDGLEYHPDAPWNQTDESDQEYLVTVEFSVIAGSEEEAKDFVLERIVLDPHDIEAQEQ